jgi:hypothetical protein
VIETITPARARELLEQLHPVHDPANPAKVAEYARAMRDGEWTPTGSIYLLDGQVVDGQHRLRAVVAADTTVEMRVMYRRRGQTRRGGAPTPN